MSHSHCVLGFLLVPLVFLAQTILLLIEQITDIVKNLAFNFFKSISFSISFPLPTWFSKRVINENILYKSASKYSVPAIYNTSVKWINCLKV